MAAFVFAVLLACTRELFPIRREGTSVHSLAIAALEDFIILLVAAAVVVAVSTMSTVIGSRASASQAFVIPLAAAAVVVAASAMSAVLALARVMQAYVGMIVLIARG